MKRYVKKFCILKTDDETFSTGSISRYYESDIKVQDSYDKTISDSCSDDEHVFVIDTSVTYTDSDADNVLGLSDHLLVSSYEGQGASRKRKRSFSADSENSSKLVKSVAEDSGTDTPSTSAAKRHLPSPVNDNIAAKYAKREELADEFNLN